MAYRSGGVAMVVGSSCFLALAPEGAEIWLSSGSSSPCMAPVHSGDLILVDFLFLFPTIHKRPCLIISKDFFCMLTYYSQLPGQNFFVFFFGDCFLANRIVDFLKN